MEIKEIYLFDVDGTLTHPRQKIKNDMLEKLAELRKKVYVGVVGGSDFNKIKEQLGDDLFKNFDYIFSENGLVSYKNGELIYQGNMREYIGQYKFNELVSFCLEYIGKLKLPCKTGTFIELRNGMINVSPIGRNCSSEERERFYLYDQKHKIREKMIQELKEKFELYNLQFSIGGMISIDIMPRNWDKTYSLKFLEEFKTIYFMGDKVDKGGNDYEIFVNPRTISKRTSSPDETIQHINKFLSFYPINH